MGHRIATWGAMVAFVLSCYLGAAAYLLDRVAATPADHAAVRVIAILAGAAGIVTFFAVILAVELGRAEADEADAAARERSAAYLD